MKKVPVDVLLHHDTLGNKIPVRVKINGIRFTVDKASGPKPGASLKAECKGMRYLITISNEDEKVYHKQCHLWLGKIESAEATGSTPEVWFVLEE